MKEIANDFIDKGDNRNLQPNLIWKIYLNSPFSFVFNVYIYISSVLRTLDILDNLDC